MTAVSLGLQGGGAHGAFTWGVLDRILDEVEAGRLTIAAISGASAGAINAAVTASGLAEGGPALARTRLREVWRLISERGALSGNGLFFGDPGLFGFNIDWSPGAIALEALGLVLSPYDNPFYRDPLGPLLETVLPPARLAALNGAAAPRVFLTAVDVAAGTRCNFSQPALSIDVLRASACLPSEFRAVQLGDDAFWDGGYLGNPALDPLLDQADDILVVFANPLTRPGPAPRNARAILDRLNEITFNASVVLEMNSIAAVNALLEDLAGKGLEYDGKYRPIHLHQIRDDAFLGELGVVSKSSTSWPLLERLHGAGHRAADRFFAGHAGDIGRRCSFDVKRDLVQKVLKAER